MAIGDSPHDPSVTAVSALAFVVAGLGALGNEVLRQLGSAELYLDLTVLLTYTGVTLGLLGIYARVTEASPRLSLTGLVATAITAVSIVVAFVAKGLLGAEPSGAEVILSIAVSVSFYLCSTLSFLLFGIACVRSRIPSRAVGYLLLVGVLSRVLVVVGVPQVASPLFGASMLGVGYLLWTDRFPTASGRPRPDPATQ